MAQQNIDLHERINPDCRQCDGNMRDKNSEDVVQMARHGQDDLLRQRFRTAYRAQLETLGYKHFAAEQVKHYYDLLFACRHPKGLEFWRKAQKYKPDQQGTFDLM